jgi:hypothetical protein
MDPLHGNHVHVYWIDVAMTFLPPACTRMLLHQGVALVSGGLSASLAFYAFALPAPCPNLYTKIHWGTPATYPSGTLPNVDIVFENAGIGPMFIHSIHLSTENGRRIDSLTDVIGGKPMFDSRVNRMGANQRAVMRGGERIVLSSMTPNDDHLTKLSAVDGVQAIRNSIAAQKISMHIKYSGRSWTPSFMQRTRQLRLGEFEQ